MELANVIALCWLTACAGFVLGAAWCGLFRTPEEPAERK